MTAAACGTVYSVSAHDERGPHDVRRPGESSRGGDARRRHARRRRDRRRLAHRRTVALHSGQDAARSARARTRGSAHARRAARPARASATWRSSRSCVRASRACARPASRSSPTWRRAAARRSLPRLGVRSHRRHAGGATSPGSACVIERRYYRKLLADLGVRIDRASYGKYKSAYRNYSVDSTPRRRSRGTDRQLDVGAGAVRVERSPPIATWTARGCCTVLDGRRVARARSAEAPALVDSIGYREDALRVLGQPRRARRRKPRVVWTRRPQPRVATWTVPDADRRRVRERRHRDRAERQRPAARARTWARRRCRARSRRAFQTAATSRPSCCAIESRGGSSAGVDLIHHAGAHAARARSKPLIVSMGGDGGAAAATTSRSPGDRLYADRFTRTGSIGVLFVQALARGLLPQHRSRQDDFERGRLHARAGRRVTTGTRELQAAADSAHHARIPRVRRAGGRRARH